MRPDLSGRHFLLLQGPPGPFFRQVARELASLGARVTKVNLNFGDDVCFWPTPSGVEVVRFRGRLETWPQFFEQLLRDEARAIDTVLTFGDGRPVHRQALDVAERAGTDAYVFEEGYLRPDYVTLEKGGVNGRSPMSRDPDFYRQAGLSPRNQAQPVGHVLFFSAWYSWVYALFFNLGRLLYPHYRHHKNLQTSYQVVIWARAALRKLAYRRPERRLFEVITRELKGRYFLVPLQCHHDIQLSYTRFGDIPEFIRHVVASFAAHAKAEQHLVFKHHPLDRAYSHYGALLAELAREHGLEGRIHYLHDEHLPTLLRQARGTVLMNSTVGLSSIHHGIPVKCLGTAIYDMPGLTFQGSLDEFWKAKVRVDGKLYRRFRGWLEKHNQLNGNVWKPSVNGPLLRALGAHLPAPAKQLRDPGWESEVSESGPRSSIDPEKLKVGGMG